VRFSRGTPPLHPLLLSYAALRCRYTVPSFPWHRPGHRPLLSSAGSAPSEFVPFVGSPAVCRRVAVASPSRAGHRAVRRAAADVAAVVVDRGGQRPDPRALPPAARRRGVAVAVARGLARDRRADDCCRSRHLAPEAHATSTAAGGRTLRGVLPRCAVASPSARAIALCAVLRLSSPPSLSTAAISDRTLVPPLRRRVVAAWPSPSRGVLPSIGARRRRSWPRVLLANLTVSWFLVSGRICFGGSWFLLTNSLANF